jgi:hypothetical protein
VFGIGPRGRLSGLSFSSAPWSRSALRGRFNVSRTVDDATPTRRAISLIALRIRGRLPPESAWRSAGFPNYGPKRHTARVLRAEDDTLQDPANETRYWAALVLGDTGDPQAIAPLVAALGDPDANLRTVAAAGLGKLGDTRAVTSLAGALDDPEEEVREVAANALKTLTRSLLRR